MRIIYFTPNWATHDDQRLLDPCGLYRMLIPGNMVQVQTGTLVMYCEDLQQRASGEIIGIGHDGMEYEGADIVVHQQYCTDEWPSMIQRAQAYGQKFVADVEDNFWEVPRNHVYYAQTKTRMRNYDAMLRVSDAIVCASAYISRYVAKHLDRDVFYIPNATYLPLWKQADLSEPVIGWYGNPAFRDWDFEMVGKALRTLKKSHDFRLTWLGANEGAASFPQAAGLPESWFESYPLTKHEEFRENLFKSGMNIGLVPMKLTPFNQGKSFLKGLEYSSCGIPFVAAASMEYKRWAKEFTAKSVNDWTKQLEWLLDYDNRVARAEQVRKLAQKESITHRWKEWWEVYEWVTQ